MHERVKRRKNFLATGVLSILLWVIWATIFFFVPPENFLTPFLFLFLTGLSVFFTAALLFANTRRGMLTAFGIAAIMVLNYFGLGNFLNLILVAGVLLVGEYYFSKNTQTTH